MALRGLLSAILHIRQEDISFLEIMNPIVLGQAIDDKEFILDVKITMNNNTIIDLELQVINYHNWPDRSLQYLCRVFNSLKQGQDYDETIAVIHIGILDMMPPHMICRGDAAGYDRIPDPVLLCRFLDAFQDQIIFLQTDNEISSKPTPFIYSHKIPSCCLYKINIAADEPILSSQTSLNNKLLVKNTPGKAILFPGVKMVFF